MNKDISNSEDILDIRDIIERIEELEDAKDVFEEQIADWDEEVQDLIDDEDIEDKDRKIEEVKDKLENWGKWEDSEEGIELKQLTDFIDEFCGYSGDEKWRGDWYPVTLIRDSYFEDYAEELANDVCEMPKDLHWPFTCIDWEKAAEELKQDYTSGEFDGVTYWGR